jgi:tetratricopeptide (TPR) repeat protein
VPTGDAGARELSLWVQRAACAVGDFTGAIWTSEIKHLDDEGIDAEFRAKLLYHHYLQTGTMESLRSAGQALQAALDAGSADPEVASMRASTVVIEASTRPENVDELLMAADDLARGALAKNPHLSQGHAVLSTVAVLRQQWDLARTHTLDAARLAPCSAVATLTAATKLTMLGDWRDGTDLALHALDLNPSVPGYMHSLIAFGYLIAEDDERALNHANLIHLPGEVYGPLYRALALDALGFRDQAVREFDVASAIDPAIATDPRTWLEQRARLDQDTRDRMLARFAHLS